MTKGNNEKMSLEAKKGPDGERQSDAIQWSVDFLWKMERAIDYSKVGPHCFFFDVTQSKTRQERQLTFPSGF